MAIGTDTIWVLYFLLMGGPSEELKIQWIQTTLTKVECEQIGNALVGKVVALRPWRKADGTALPQADFYCHGTQLEFYFGSSTHD